MRASLAPAGADIWTDESTVVIAVAGRFPVLGGTLSSEVVAVNVIASFLQSLAPHPLCLRCLARAIDAEVPSVSTQLLQLERQGTVSAAMSVCLHCFQRRTTYEIGI